MDCCGTYVYLFPFFCFSPLAFPVSRSAVVQPAPVVRTVARIAIARWGACGTAHAPNARAQTRPFTYYLAREFRNPDNSSQQETIWLAGREGVFAFFRPAQSKEEKGNQACSPTRLHCWIASRLLLLLLLYGDRPNGRHRRRRKRIKERDERTYVVVVII